MNWTTRKRSFRSSFSQKVSDSSFRLDISIDPPSKDDISNITANLTIVSGNEINSKKTTKIPYYGITFKNQSFFILVGTFSKDDEVDYDWARNFFRNKTITNNKKSYYFRHSKQVTQFFENYPNSHIAFRIVTISFRVREQKNDKKNNNKNNNNHNNNNNNNNHNKINNNNNNNSNNKNNNKYLDQSQSIIKNMDSSYESKEIKENKNNFNKKVANGNHNKDKNKDNNNIENVNSAFSLPFIAEGTLFEGDKIKMQINGVEYDSRHYSIEVRIYLVVIIGLNMALSFYAWHSLSGFARSQARVSAISFLSLLTIFAFDVTSCVDFNRVNECYKAPALLSIYLFFAQLVIYLILQFPLLYHVYKQQQSQQILQNSPNLQNMHNLNNLQNNQHLQNMYNLHNMQNRRNVHYYLRCVQIHFQNNSSLYFTLFQLFVFILVLFSSFAFNSNNYFNNKSIRSLRMQKTIYSLVISLSQWIPQIVKNMMLLQRRGVNLCFVILVSLNRLIFFLYSENYRYNIYETGTTTRFPLTTTTNSVSLPAILIFVQCVFLICQNHFGPFFFLPKIFKPKPFDYRAELPEPGTECSVCQDPILDNEEDVAVTPCHHAFHMKCLKRWMEEKQECPLCRYPIPPVDGAE